MRPPEKCHVYTLFLVFLLLLAVPALSQDDGAVLIDLKKSLNNPPASWTGSDPCTWGSGIQCENTRVTRIQIGNRNLFGSLPASLKKLSELTVFEVMNNHLWGPLPSFSGLANLQTLNLHTNNFTSLPPDFFSGMTSLGSVFLDYNPFASWTVPAGLTDASGLREFSANSANLTGPVPEIFSGKNFPGLQSLHLALNYLEGELPSSLAGTSIQSLWLNGQKTAARLNGSIAVIGNMTSLTELWLNMNSFTGGLPDFSGLTGLQNLTLRDNQLTGPVPTSLVSLKSLLVVNLTNNNLQGPTPKFSSGVSLDMIPGTNRFCTDTPGGQCSDLVNVLLEIAGGFLYPQVLAKNWPGNDPCINDNMWKGITCLGSNVTVINFMNLGLAGTISPSFSKIPSLQKILLANNFISGSIPDSLTGVSSLVELDVSNNNLHGPVPVFQKNVVLNDAGNVDINRNSSSTPSGGSPVTPGGSNGGGSSSGGDKSKSSSNKAKFVVPVVAVACCTCIVGLGVLYFRRRRKRSSKLQGPSMVVIHPHNSDDAVKITIAESNMSGATGSSSYTTGASSDLQVVEAGSMMISIQVLREVTNNFSEAKILGKGGFGTVYKGELHDGTQIAVKRMESGLVSEKGLTEFRSEIDVLNKVRHRHLVTLHGYCLDGNEKLLVYEYMPQGPLSRYLFHWEEENLKPLDWSRRLIIALDVARGVEYLHGLAQHTFIHRDLKPSNILLDDRMRAKVADFGLVRLAPEGKASIATTLAGTFGYLAPEYAVTGRVSTKIDVFSFGVILMELISGRKALDESQPEDSFHLVTWFRRKAIEKKTFHDAIDPSIELNEEILASVMKVAELAGHCTAREPHQRPDMGHVVNVLSSLVELWKPTEAKDEDMYAIDLGMTLPQTLKKWQDFADTDVGDSTSSSLPGSNDNTESSLPNRPYGFAESFQSADAR